MNKSEIATNFSNGDFEKCFEYLTDDTLWETPGEQTLKGKAAIKSFCEKTRQYFDSVTTDFKQLNIIENENSVAINGTAKFIKEEKIVSQVASCDVYTFDANNKIITIYSYCIPER
jgi:ketosteroid isomerase-like protein